jgi:hypothetical protein
MEAALALMRLSTEKFFVLLSLYVAFLLFRTPPPYAAALIGLNARISNAFARLVLYSFPAVCWVYGAGVLFSSLVSGMQACMAFPQASRHLVMCTQGCGHLLAHTMHSQDGCSTAGV